MLLRRQMMSLLARQRLAARLRWKPQALRVMAAEMADAHEGAEEANPPSAKAGELSSAEAAGAGQEEAGAEAGAATGKEGEGEGGEQEEGDGGMMEDKAEEMEAMVGALRPRVRLRGGSRGGGGFHCRGQGTADGETAEEGAATVSDEGADTVPEESATVPEEGAAVPEEGATVPEERSYSARGGCYSTRGGCYSTRGECYSARGGCSSCRRRETDVPAGGLDGAEGEGRGDETMGGRRGSGGASEKGAWTLALPLVLPPMPRQRLCLRLLR